MVTSDKPMHLGYHGDITDNGSTGKSITKSDRDHSSSTSKDKTSHDTKLSSSSTSDNSTAHKMYCCALNLISMSSYQP